MKRLLAIFGVFALLGTLFVIATAVPSAAGTAGWTAKNTGTTGTIQVIATPATGEVVKWKVGPASTAGKKLQTGVEYSITAVDADHRCTVDGGTLKGVIYSSGSWNVKSGSWSVTKTCAAQGSIVTQKRSTHVFDRGAVKQSTYKFSIAPTTDNPDTAQKNDWPWANQCGDPLIVTQKGGKANDVKTSVPASVIYKNEVKPCPYNVVELTPPAGQKCVYPNASSFGPSQAPAVCGTLVVGPDNPTYVEFGNKVKKVPLTVTKTFRGRDYYTTVDRADFHIYTPGLCGTLPIDPFGGLLGSAGVYRTINASQSPQIVIYLPDILKAGGTGRCTYRVQENNLPQGCTAVNPTGRNADGPYWEKTWKPGMTAMVFDIVNNCSQTALCFGMTPTIIAKPGVPTIGTSGPDVILGPPVPTTSPVGVAPTRSARSRAATSSRVVPVRTRSPSVRTTTPPKATRRVI